MDTISCVLFPSPCRLCGDPLLRLSRIPVCGECLQQAPAPDRVLCSICGEDLHVATFPTQNPAPSPLRGNIRICEPCRLVPPAFEKAISHGDYHGNLRALIHLLKFEGIEPLAQLLGHWLANAITAASGGIPHTLTVIPVPLWHARQKSRGFNQAALLAAAAIAHLHHQNSAWHLEPAWAALGRQRATATQTGRTGRQRRLNLKGAFYVRDPKAIAGKDLLLVDDVFTTGATARECSRTLLDAGASRVWVATLARSQWKMGQPGTSWVH